MLLKYLEPKFARYSQLSFWSDGDHLLEIFDGSLSTFV